MKPCEWLCQRESGAPSLSSRTVLLIGKVAGPSGLKRDEDPCEINHALP